MVARITHTFYVIDFSERDFDSDHITTLAKAETDGLLQRFPIEALADWEVEFRVIYGNTPTVQVYTRMPSYVRDKQKLIVIHIPIPLRTTVAWGVEPTQHIVLGTHPNQAAYARYVVVPCTDFTNCTDYIVAALRRGIRLCFEQGFKVNSYPIKAAVHE